MMDEAGPQAGESWMHLTMSMIICIARPPPVLYARIRALTSAGEDPPGASADGIGHTVVSVGGQWTL